MRCLNHVVISGEVDRIAFATTKTGTPACGFQVRTSNARSSARVKINVYGDPLVELCRASLQRGLYVVVEGELMNREGRLGELTEIRATQVIFPYEGIVPEVALELPEGENNGG